MKSLEKSQRMNQDKEQCKSSSHSRAPQNSDQSLNQLSLDLKSEDMEQLLGDEWLTDSHVKAFNKLCSLNGFQDPCQVARPDKAYKSKSCNFIQVVNVSNIHWVCVSNVLSSPGVAEVYDSKPNYSIGSSVLHEQVAKILRSEEKSFQLNHVDVQRQRVK